VDHLSRLTRLTWLLAACVWTLLAADVARAADCPISSQGYTPPDWPIDRTSQGVWAGTHISTYSIQYCGIQLNTSAAWSPANTTSFAALQSQLAAAHAGSEWKLKAQCAYANVGANSYGWVIIYGTDNAQQYRRGYRITSGTTAAACTPVNPTPPCSTFANQSIIAQSVDQPDSFVPEDLPCLGGCAAYKEATQPYHRLGTPGHREFLTRYRMTGLTCTVETPVVPNPTKRTDEICIGSGADAFCTNAAASPGCGYVNSKYVCTKSVQPNKCWKNTDGSMLCAEGAGSPPKPTAPDKSPAVPNNTIETCTGANSCQTANYYNSSTVSASGTPVEAPGETDVIVGPTAGGTTTGGTGTGGTGTGTDPTSDDSAGGGAGCDAAPTCSGDPIACAQLQQQWRIRCPADITESDALAAAGVSNDEIAGNGPNDADVDVGTLSSSGGISVGSCPAPLNVNIMGQAISMDIWQAGCQMALLFAPITMLLSYLGAAFMLIRGTS